MLKFSQHLLFSFVFIALFNSCTSVPQRPVLAPDVEIDPKAITVMTYNLENLFDTEDDPDKKDEAYLPLAKKDAKVRAKCRTNSNVEYFVKRCIEDDWSERHLKMKIARLVHVIRTIKNGKGPDILIAQEVENQPVLDRLRLELKDLGYKPAILIEGPDERGIDVGIITRLDQVNPAQLHLQTFTPNEAYPEENIRPTRGILQADLKLPDGQTLTVLGVHFPSQGAPTEARRQAVVRLNEIQSKLPKDRMVIAGGDFNITSDEEIKQKYAARELSDQWGVSHIIGCEKCPQGTYYYRRLDQWSFLDMLLFSKNLLPEGNSPWKALPESIRVEAKSRYQVSRWDTPSRFSDARTTGVSDHWPLLAEIVPREKTKGQGEKK